MITRDALLARRLGEGEHEIPDVGTVRIRGLSRAVVLEVQALVEVAAADRKMLVAALVDPAVTEDDVAVWQQNSPPLEIEKLIEAIRELSGMGDGASKAAYKRIRK